MATNEPDDSVDGLAQTVADALLAKGMAVCKGDRSDAAAFAWVIAQTVEDMLYEHACRFPKFVDAMGRARTLAATEESGS